MKWAGTPLGLAVGVQEPLQLRVTDGVPLRVMLGVTEVVAVGVPVTALIRMQLDYDERHITQRRAVRTGKALQWTV